MQRIVAAYQTLRRTEGLLCKDELYLWIKASGTFIKKIIAKHFSTEMYLLFIKNNLYIYISYSKTKKIYFVYWFTQLTVLKWLIYPKIYMYIFLNKVSYHCPSFLINSDSGNYFNVSLEIMLLTLYCTYTHVLASTTSRQQSIRNGWKAMWAYAQQKFKKIYI